MGRHKKNKKHRNKNKNKKIKEILEEKIKCKKCLKLNSKDLYYNLDDEVCNVCYLPIGFNDPNTTYKDKNLFILNNILKETGFDITIPKNLEIDI